MIKVAICDDEHDTLRYVGDMITHYAALNRLDLSIDRFSRAKDLEMQIEQNGNYQIYIHADAAEKRNRCRSDNPQAGQPRSDYIPDIIKRLCVSGIWSICAEIFVKAPKRNRVLRSNGFCSRKCTEHVKNALH